MNISKTAKAAGLTTKTVRYYADIGLVKPVSRTEARYRTYDQSTINRLIFVRRARSFGFSICECRELLKLYDDDQRSSADVKKMALKRLDDIRKKEYELSCLRDELDRLVKSCRGDHKPDCPIINYLS